MLYVPFPSSRKHKKYAVYVLKGGRKRLIHFGDKRYQQFEDKLGTYSELDHRDEKRRDRYYARHGRTADKNTALYWANTILW